MIDWTNPKLAEREYRLLIVVYCECSLTFVLTYLTS